ncbi:MAG: acyl-CoA desaturase [Synechococcus sp.]
MQLNSAEIQSSLQSVPSWRGRSSVTMLNDRLTTVQQLFGYAAVFIPFIGTLVAVGSLGTVGFDWVTGTVAAVMYLATLIGITVGYHRLLSHSAFQTGSAVKAVLAVLGSMAAQGHVIHWVSNHRRHHQCSDADGDPHSPHIGKTGESLGGLYGFWHSHVGWLFEGEFPNVLLSKDLLKDRVLVRINQSYLLWVLLGFAIPAAIGGMWLDSWTGVVRGLLWGGFVRVFLVHHAIWSVNSVTHLFGRRPFATRERSTNNVWTAIPTGGEGWHNNHHAFPNSAMFGLTWWQVDIGGWTIGLLEILGLAWSVKVPSPEMQASKRVKS